MNISEMDTKEKSRLIVELTKEHIGWSITNNPPATGYIIRLPDNSWTDDIYHTQHMALAWRVLAAATTKLQQDIAITDFIAWWRYRLPFLFALPPAEAQAAWLDKILELAIEAGMVQPAVTEAQP
jgi:hypothetical protein